MGRPTQDVQQKEQKGIGAQPVPLGATTKWDIGDIALPIARKQLDLHHQHHDQHRRDHLANVGQMVVQTPTNHASFHLNLGVSFIMHVQKKGTSQERPSIGVLPRPTAMVVI